MLHHLLESQQFGRVIDAVKGGVIFLQVIHDFGVHGMGGGHHKSRMVANFTKILERLEKKNI